MLCIPIDKINELGYYSQKVLAKESARELPEYNTFSNEVFLLENNEVEFIDNLFKIAK